MRVGGGGWQRGRRQLQPDQGLHSIPNVRITLNLSVWLHEKPVVPGIFRTLQGAGVIVKTEVSNDARPCRIGGANSMAVDKSMGLIKVGGLNHVGRYKRAVDAGLGDTIYLHGKKHWNALFFQRTCQDQGFRAAPAMPVNNDLGIFFLFRRQSSAMVDVQELQNFSAGSCSTITFKSLHIHARGIILAQALSELNLAVDRIVVFDEPSDESDNDGWRSYGNVGPDDRAD